MPLPHAVTVQLLSQPSPLIVLPSSQTSAPNPRCCHNRSVCKHRPGHHRSRHRWCHCHRRKASPTGIPRRRSVALDTPCFGKRRWHNPSAPHNFCHPSIASRARSCLRSPHPFGAIALAIVTGRVNAGFLPQVADLTVSALIIGGTPTDAFTIASTGGTRSADRRIGIGRGGATT